MHIYNCRDQISIALNLKEQLKELRTQQKKNSDKIKSLQNQLKQQKQAKDKRIKKLKDDKKKLQAENRRLKKKLVEQRKELTDEIKQKNALLLKIQSSSAAPSKEARDKILIEALLPFFTLPQINRMLFNKKTHWTKEDYSTAVILIGLSSRTYRYIRNEMGIPLPAVSSVRAYIARIEIREGLMQSVIDLMAAKGKMMCNLSKQVVVSFDEVSISSDFALDSVEDKVLGSHKKSQVVMARGLMSPWKNPIYYAYDTDMSEDILDQVISALHTAGFSVVAMVSDLGGQNRGMLTNLGYTKDSPWFLHPVTARKIYVFADVPHLLKLARNHLFDNKFHLNSDEKIAADQVIARKEPLEELLQLNALNELQPHKVTWVHLQAKGCDRQKVILATQLLSNSTAASLECAADKGLISAEYTKAAKVYISKLIYFLLIH